MAESDIPDGWVLALGGGGGGAGTLSQLVSADGEGRSSTGTTAAIMREAGGGTSTLPRIPSAVDQAHVAGACSDCPPPPTGSRAPPTIKKPEPFSMAALMESARRKAMEKKEEAAAKARGETFRRVASNDTMDANMRNYKEQQQALQGKLKGLSSSLRKFDIRAAEAEIEHEQVRRQARSAAALMWKGLKGAGVPNRPSPFDLMPPDMINKILCFLRGKHLFMALCSSKRFDCADVEFWSELLLREHCEQVPPTAAARELKEMYRHNELCWSRLISTFTWLKSQGCPSDVHGTRSGPWSKVTLLAVLTDCVGFTDVGAAGRRCVFGLRVYFFGGDGKRKEERRMGGERGEGREEIVTGVDP